MIDYAEAIKEAVSCQQFAEFVGLKINKAGFAVCPFHGDKDASLKIYKGGRGWCCFGCHKGGDVINFASLYYGLSFKDTLKRLNDDFNLGLYKDNEKSSETAPNRILSAVEIARRKTARLKKEREERALECEYWIAFDKWLRCERIIRNFVPRSKNDDFPVEYVKALHDINGLKDRLENLEMRRISYNG